MCVHVSMYVCMHVCMYTYIHTCMYVYTRIHTYAHTHNNTHTHTRHLRVPGLGVVVLVVCEHVVDQGRDHLGLVVQVCNVMGLVMGLVIHVCNVMGLVMGLVTGLLIGRDHLGNDTVHFFALVYSGLKEA